MFNLYDNNVGRIYKLDKGTKTSYFFRDGGKDRESGWIK